MELTADLVLGNDNGPPVLGNGPQLLGIMSQFGIMSHLALCPIRGYVVRHYIAFGLMSFGIMSHSALCCIWPYVVRLCVVRRNVAWRNVVWRYVARPTVGVSLVVFLTASGFLWQKADVVKTKGAAVSSV